MWQNKSIKSMNKYFKLPFQIDPASIYIRDAEGHAVFNWLFRDEGLKRQILEAINTESTLGLGEISISGGKIYINGQPMLLVRGWGYLTGIGGLHLPIDEAIEVQDEVLKYVAARL